MGYSKILVGYDCSDASNRALADAYELVDHGLAEGVVVLTGSRGLGAVRSLLGSVSTAVLRESEIPVLVTK